MLTMKAQMSVPINMSNICVCVWVVDRGSGYSFMWCRWHDSLLPRKVGLGWCSMTWLTLHSVVMH
ncbi:hypothetical protein BJV74DRAFT_857382 [Russula compacta]|nr:hypothetical protein BJV74DRAFT_857382 [Russula compacta]